MRPIVRAESVRRALTRLLAGKPPQLLAADLIAFEMGYETGAPVIELITEVYI